MQWSITVLLLFLSSLSDAVILFHDHWEHPIESGGQSSLGGKQSGPKKSKPFSFGLSAGNTPISSASSVATASANTPFLANQKQIKLNVHKELSLERLRQKIIKKAGALKGSVDTPALIAGLDVSQAKLEEIDWLPLEFFQHCTLEQFKTMARMRGSGHNWIGMLSDHKAAALVAHLGDAILAEGEAALSLPAHLWAHLDLARALEACRHRLSSTQIYHLFHLHLLDSPQYAESVASSIQGSIRSHRHSAIVNNFDAMREMSPPPTAILARFDHAQLQMPHLFNRLTPTLSLEDQFVHNSHEDGVDRPHGEEDDDDTNDDDGEDGEEEDEERAERKEKEKGKEEEAEEDDQGSGDKDDGREKKARHFAKSIPKPIPSPRNLFSGFPYSYPNGQVLANSRSRHYQQLTKSFEDEDEGVNHHHRTHRRQQREEEDATFIDSDDDGSSVDDSKAVRAKSKSPKQPINSSIKGQHASSSSSSHPASKKGSKRTQRKSSSTIAPSKAKKQPSFSADHPSGRVKSSSMPPPLLPNEKRQPRRKSVRVAEDKSSSSSSPSRSPPSPMTMAANHKKQPSHQRQQQSLQSQPQAQSPQQKSPVLKPKKVRPKREVKSQETAGDLIVPLRNLHISPSNSIPDKKVVPGSRESELTSSAWSETESA